MQTDRELLLERMIADISAGRTVLVEDFSGNLSAFSEGIRPDINHELIKVAERLKSWSGDFAIVANNDSADALIFEAVWAQGAETANAHVRLLVRRTGHGDWFKLEDPIWDGKPWKAAFYSFKGGVGRTTALLAFAIHATRIGQSVFLIDADLDSPGLYAVFQDRRDSPPADMGLVDYLVAIKSGVQPAIADYVSSHVLVEGGAPCYLLHGGTVNAEYLDKLSRADTGMLAADRSEGFRRLMSSIRDEYLPDWILLDTRSGLSDSAALATSGLFDLVVAVATNTEQNWLGLTQIADRLGRARVKLDKDQHDCLFIQSLVPPGESQFGISTESFKAKATEVMEQNYYVESGGDEGGRFLTVDDARGTDAPDTPAVIRVSERLSQYNRLASIVDDIVRDGDYERFATRILSRYDETLEAAE